MLLEVNHLQGMEGQQDKKNEKAAREVGLGFHLTHCLLKISYTTLYKQLKDLTPIPSNVSIATGVNEWVTRPRVLYLGMSRAFIFYVIIVLQYARSMYKNYA